MWQQCGMANDFLTTALLPWQWITGGYFSMILVSVFVIMTYIKYQKVVYPIMIGTLFFPVSYFLFPSAFINWAIIMTGLALALLVAYIYVSQTNES